MPRNVLMLIVAAGALAACEATFGPGPDGPQIDDVTAFEGADVDTATDGFQNLGYSATRSEGASTYWYNEATGGCVQTMINDNVFASVNASPPGSC